MTHDGALAALLADVVAPTLSLYGSVMAGRALPSQALTCAVVGPVVHGVHPVRS